MDLTKFTLSLLLLALPGLVARTLFRLWIGRTERHPWEDAVEIALFSIGAYGMLAAIENEPAVLEGLSSPDQGSTPWSQIGWATLIAFGLAALASAAHRYHVPNRLGVLLRISGRFGEQDVWEHFQRRHGKRHAIVRDHLQGISYFGRLRAYSTQENGDGRELVLANVVAVDSETGAEVYQMQEVYLSRTETQVTIELPYREDIEEEDADGRQEQNATAEKAS